jgi:hypothetical protein
LQRQIDALHQVLYLVEDPGGLAAREQAVVLLQAEQGNHKSHQRI